MESHQEMCKAKIDCKKIIAQAKLEYWKSFTLNLDHRVDLGSVYKQIKKMKQQYCLPDYDLREGDRVLKTRMRLTSQWRSAFSGTGTESLKGRPDFQ